MVRKGGAHTGVSVSGSSQSFLGMKASKMGLLKKSGIIEVSKSSPLSDTNQRSEAPPSTAARPMTGKGAGPTKATRTQSGSTSKVSLDAIVKDAHHPLRGADVVNSTKNSSLAGVSDVRDVSEAAAMAANATGGVGENGVGSPMDRALRSSTHAPVLMAGTRAGVSFGLHGQERRTMSARNRKSGPKNYNEDSDSDMTEIMQDA